MKNISLLIFLFSSIPFFAQVKNNSIKVGFQTGSSAHIGATGFGYHAEYDYSFFDRFSATIGFGQYHGNATSNGRSRGTAGGVSWDNSYELYSSEGSNYLETNLNYSYFRVLNFIDLKIGGGVTFLSNWVNYDKDVVLVRGVIISSEETRHRNNASMVNIVLDNEFKITNQFFINGKFIFRKTFNRQEPLVRVTNYGSGGIGTSNSELDAMAAMVIGIGYRF